ncbi:MAG: homoserine O-acetyltransferase MetX, partial [Jatrophihabitans sp.]|uniref:homoserine O-acetyltransferase MetX n=1 Tax=Jatrophihabitans sp. TaxID=1932789 RepID=UPI003F7F0DC5
ADLGAVALEVGVTLPGVRVAYETWGAPQRDASGAIGNAVLVLHALTGDAHVAGPTGPDQPTPGWWDGMVGPGRPLDPAEHFVVAANVLGGCRGTTGPSSVSPDGRPWGSRFPAVTIRDQVEVEAQLADHLGITRFRAVLGGSMGGMRALEWVVGRPERVAAALVLAVGARATADQLGTQSTQVLAIRSDPHWHGGDYHAAGVVPADGLGLARRIAQLTYRGEGELDTRFEHRLQDDGRFAMVSYLDHHAAKLVRRFDAGTYVALTEAMNTHDVGRDRGGVVAALASTDVPVVVGGIDTDRLYPLRLQQELADGLPGCAGLDVIESPYGHDAFLIEVEAVGELVRRTLALAADRAPAGRAAL